MYVAIRKDREKGNDVEQEDLNLFLPDISKVVFCGSNKNDKTSINLNPAISIPKE